MSTRRESYLWIGACVGVVLLGRALHAEEQNAAGLELFESRIRPLLVQKCFSCHGKLANPKGGLRLLSREMLLKGGDRGPALDEAELPVSLLLQAVRREHEGLAMPPDGPLADFEVAALERWVELGAPWPSKSQDRWAGQAEESAPDWAFQPLESVEPLAETTREGGTPIDAFLEKRQREQGVTASPAADKRTLLRRLTFDLIGLPPTPEEIEAFVQDDRPEAWSDAVERLLGSPHYGERWARHWLDVVGFAETDGHEYDPEKPNAFRYRDYVIEAFNRDLPYDQFVREHIAGDLIVPARLDREGKRCQSRLATGFFWLGEVQAVPVDRAMVKAIETERQIDVIGKSFLGLTVACARCHDHKFDPISTADYYGLAGYLYSTKKVQACVDSPAQQHAVASAQRRALELEARIGELIARGTRRSRLKQAQHLSGILLKSLEAPREDQPSDPWLAHFTQKERGRDPIFYPWFRLTAEGRGGDLSRRAHALGAQLASVLASGGDEKEEVFEDFEAPAYEGWESLGKAFGSGPLEPDASVQDGYVGTGYASSRRGSDRLIGRLTSREFAIEKGYIGFWIAGGAEPGKTCLNITEEGQVLPKLTATGPGEDTFVWRVLDARTLVGRKARVELVDESSAPGGHLLVDHIVFSDVEPDPGQPPNRPPNQAVVRMLNKVAIESPAALAEAYQTLVQEILRKEEKELTAGEREVLRWVLAGDHPWKDEDVRAALDPGELEELAALEAKRAALEKEFPESAFGLVAADGLSCDLRVQVAGNPHDLGDYVPRGFLSVFAKSTKPPPEVGSGRMDLAESFVREARDLLARVMVNRIWQYHFGTGIVATPDNFGALGARPSHPQLLDYLARQFIESGWSIKEMHREMLLTEAYRRSSRPTESAVSKDPDNRLLTHMPVRRLDAESLRDAILTVAGSLDRTMFGPSIPLHVTPMMEGRDVPEVSGSLAGNGRRSIYLEVRRNHRAELLGVFDQPRGNSTTGRRPVSTVPAQALTLLNDELVWMQAQEWARRSLVAGGSERATLARMYEEATGRPPSISILEDVEAFMAAQHQRYRAAGLSDGEIRSSIYRDYAHVLFNLAEFLHVY